ncbi:GGDEF domain-containing protein [Saccharibacillus brassicae]|uniref:Diguanylate cyclase n=1 Tax=Saccharibacillus brassicae TaxID=2583377 RepID=A0A4Y6UXS8_SACBS|nr:GGDEF domain-containing protein [Saccharibacillus brassicae]QDH20825.1 diguanylate cyclase [Saccharibacillus brassicae]
MFKDLFVNFTILATLLFFGNVFFNRFRKSSWAVASASSAWLPWATGIALGLVGIVLMEFSFPIGRNSVVDLRQTAIIIAIYVAGIPGGLGAGLLIGVFRLFFFGEFGLSSYVGGTNAIVTFICVALVLRKGRLEPLRWAAAFAIQFVLLMISLYIMVGTTALHIIPVYSVIIAGTGVFTFFMLRHLNNSNELFAFMEDAAHRDFLTGLHNPRSFHFAYDRRMKRTLKNDEGFGLILLDIDHFKRVNDTHGHPAGDLVLQQLGKILMSCSPADSYCARNGGEEFAVVLDRREEDAVMRLAEKIRAAVESHAFLLDDGTKLKLTVSIGYGRTEEGSPRTLFRRVDDALYHAKESGRNRISKASSEIGSGESPPDSGSAPNPPS